MTDIQFKLVENGDPSLSRGPTLYKRDSKGKLRTWAMQLDESGRYRTFSGLANGKQAVSGWTTPEPKSKPTVKEQGEFEVRSQYQHQLDREYRLTEAELDSVKDEFIQPMLAKSYGEWPGPGYAQPKLDGIRCIMTKDGMFTRQGQPITAVPHLHAAAAPLFIADPDLILDGELYNHDLREDFGAISSIVRKKNPAAEQLMHAEKVMQYHVYDIVDSSVPFADRILTVDEILSNLGCSWLIPVETIRCRTQEQSDAAYGQFVEQGYEGGIYRLDKPYELGKRSKFLLKRKDFMTEEFKVFSIEEGNGNWAGAAKRMLLQNNAGPDKPGAFGAGIRGSMTQMVQLLREWEDHPEWWSTATATLRFFGRSPDGVPRFPVVVDFQPNGRLD